MNRWKDGRRDGFTLVYSHTSRTEGHLDGGRDSHWFIHTLHEQRDSWTEGGFTLVYSHTSRTEDSWTEGWIHIGLFTHFTNRGAVGRREGFTLVYLHTSRTEGQLDGGTDEMTG